LYTVLSLLKYIIARYTVDQRTFIDLHKGHHLICAKVDELKDKACRADGSCDFELNQIVYWVFINKITNFRYNTPIYLINSRVKFEKQWEITVRINLWISQRVVKLCYQYQRQISEFKHICLEYRVCAIVLHIWDNRSPQMK